ncbi:MAG: type VI secretion system accessory protein TagJ [Pseudomonadota bacterium]
MTALELLQSGDLNAALEDLQDQVRKSPADSKLRIFLFQLHCALGDWDRALTQLRVCGKMDEAALPMAQTYREAIGCELIRERVFKGETPPLVFGEPQKWIALLIEAVGALGRGDAASAAGLREEAFETAPTTSGKANDTAFEWIADADMRLGPVLEVIMNGRYYWAPFNCISSIEMDEPTDLRDAVWTPATVTWANGGQVPALIPTRYPGLSETWTNAHRLSRATDWADVGSDTFVGIGQRVLATDADDIALMDIRALSLDVEAPEAPEEGETEAEPGDG